MANQTKNPSKLPGAMGWLDETIAETAELIMGGEGRFVNEGPLTNQELKAIQHQSPEAGQAVSKPTIGGSSEIMFNDPAEAGIREVRRVIEQAQITSQQVEQVSQSKDIQEEVRFEVAGMSDDQLAAEGDFSNTSVTNRAIVRSVANRMWIFFKRVANKIAAGKAEAARSIAETKPKGKSAMQGYFEGASGSQGNGQANMSAQAVG